MLSHGRSGGGARRSRRLIAPVVGVLAVGVLVTLVGVADGRSAPARSVSRMLTTDISGGTREQQALLREILAGFSQSQLSQISFVSPPEDFEPQDATWLQFDVSASDQPNSVRGFWQALMVAGAFRDESAVRRLPYVAGKTITVRAPDGTVLDEGSSLIEQPLGHNVTPASDASLRTMLQSAATRAKVRVRGISFAHPLGRPGAEVTVTTTDANAFIRNRQTKLRDLLGALYDPARPQADGVYLEVLDSAGQVVTSSGYSVRTGEGVGYTRPTLQAIRPTSSFGGFSR